MAKVQRVLFLALVVSVVGAAPPAGAASSFSFYFPLVFKQILLEPVGDLPIANPSFEGGWTENDPSPGNQCPNSWVCYSPAAGVLLPIPEKMDQGNVVPAYSNGPGEYVHKLAAQLPPEEQLGGPRALILDGQVVYKAFGGHANAIVLSQTLSGTPGDYARVTAYILAEWSGGFNSPEDDKAMARVKLGDLVEDRRTFAEMRTHFDIPGNERAWNNVEVIAQFPGSGKLVLEILMQNNWSLVNTDFFLDDVSGQTLRSP